MYVCIYIYIYIYTYCVVQFIDIITYVSIILHSLVRSHRHSRDFNPLHRATYFPRERCTII